MGDDLDVDVDGVISPDLIADSQRMPPIQPNLTQNNTIDNLINDCDLSAVGMEASEARQILQELMNLKTDLNTPMATPGMGISPEPKAMSPLRRGLSEGMERRRGSGTSSLSALQTFQHTWKSSNFEPGLAAMHEEEAMQRAQQQVFGSLAAAAESKQEMNDEMSEIFPNYSLASKSQFGLRSVSTTGSMMRLNNKEEGDMLESMVSNQIELKLQQTQLEAAMTKMELLDELKVQVHIVDPARDVKRLSKNDFGMPRISTIIEPMNLDQLANGL